MSTCNQIPSKRGWFVLIFEVWSAIIFLGNEIISILITKLFHYCPFKPNLIVNINIDFIHGFVEKLLDMKVGIV